MAKDKTNGRFHKVDVKKDTQDPIAFVSQVLEESVGPVFIDLSGFKRSKLSIEGLTQVFEQLDPESGHTYLFAVPQNMVDELLGVVNSYKKSAYHRIPIVVADKQSAQRIANQRYA